MEKIGEVLKGDKRFKRPDILVREKTVEIIKKEIGVDIDIKKIKVRECVITIDTFDPILKSEIFIRKNVILEAIRESVDKNIKDIR